MLTGCKLDCSGAGLRLASLVKEGRLLRESSLAVRRAGNAATAKH